jgi:ABC-2 type transport system permease protein
MIYITVILKEFKIMIKMTGNVQNNNKQLMARITLFFESINIWKRTGSDSQHVHPFRVLVNKDISDHVRSWRFIILLILIALTCLGSVYTGVANIGNAVKSTDPENSFFFLKLFTVSDGTLPPFFVFVSFLGPLLGISMGFDAINSEQNKGTLSRVLAQPIHRDYLINAKFTAALYVISIMFFSLGLLVMGFGILTTGIPPTAEEFLRVVLFLLISILYVSFWLNLSILFSVLFRQPSTSALSGIAIWLFFTVFYSIIVRVIAKAAVPSATATTEEVVSYQELIMNMLRVVPSQLFSDATTVLLAPSIRSLGPLTMEQVVGTIPGPIPIGQSLLLIWPQITGLIAATILCFVLSYVYFMRREIRSR